MKTIRFLVLAPVALGRHLSWSTVDYCLLHLTSRISVLGNGRILISDTLRECLYWLIGTDKLLSTGFRLHQTPPPPHTGFLFIHASTLIYLQPPSSEGSTAAHAGSRRKLRWFLVLGCGAEVCKRPIRSGLPGRRSTQGLGSLPADSPPVVYQYHRCAEAEQLMWEVCDVLVCTVLHPFLLCEPCSV